MDKEDLFEKEESMDIVDLLDPDILRSYMEDCSPKELEPQNFGKVLGNNNFGKWKKKAELTPAVNVWKEYMMEHGGMTKAQADKQSMVLIEEAIASKRLSVGDYGIKESGKGYSVVKVISGVANVTLITDFLFENVREAVTDNGDIVMVVDIKSDTETRKNVEISSKEANNMLAMGILIGSKVNRGFTADATIRDFNLLIAYIRGMVKERMERADVLGYNYKEGIPYFSYLAQDKNNKIIKTMKPSRENIDINIYDSSANAREIEFKYDSIKDADWKDLLKSIIKHLPLAYPRDKAIIALSWFLVTPLRHLGSTAKASGEFPILAVAGTPGSGKTTLIKLLSRMMGYTGTGKSYSKMFTIITNMASSNTQFTWVDEYKVEGDGDKRKASNFADLLRKSYDGGIEERGRADQSKVVYRLVAPMVISGESEFTDRALLERTIQIIMSNEETSQSSHKESFDTLYEMADRDIHLFAGNYHQWILDRHKEWDIWLSASKKIMQNEFSNVPSRYVSSAAWIATGMLIINELCGETILEEDDMRGILRNSLHNSIEMGNSVNLSAAFAQFLSENWHSIPQSSVYTETVQKDGDIWFFHAPLWKKAFRNYCRDSDIGDQQDNIINRAIEEMIKNGSIMSKSHNRRYAGKVSKSIQVNIKKLSAKYDIEEEMWTSEE